MGQQGHLLYSVWFTMYQLVPTKVAWDGSESVNVFLPVAFS